MIQDLEHTWICISHNLSPSSGVDSSKGRAKNGASITIPPMRSTTPQTPLSPNMEVKVFTLEESHNNNQHQESARSPPTTPPGCKMCTSEQAITGHATVAPPTNLQVDRPLGQSRRTFGDRIGCPGCNQQPRHAKQASPMHAPTLQTRRLRSEADRWAPNRPGRAITPSATCQGRSGRKTEKRRERRRGGEKGDMEERDRNHRIRRWRH
jgi:hypothetical protein